MLAGALIYLPESIGIEALDGCKWEREENGIKLTSVIQFKENIGDEKLDAYTGTAFHQSLRLEATLKEDQGKFKIVYSFIPNTISADVIVVSGRLPSGRADPFIIVDNLDNRYFVTEIVKNGLQLEPETVNQVRLNTNRLAKVHSEQWLRSFTGREGKVDSGMVFGEDIEQDDVFGPELERSSSESVGWVTNFFGPPTKVRVSPRGSVTIMAWPTQSQLAKFIMKEIVPFIVLVQ